MSHDLEGQVRDLSRRNQQLTTLLKASRDKLADLNQQLSEIAEPASTFGTFLEWAGKDADVFVSGRRMRVKVAPGVSDIAPGALVRLGEGTIVVEECGRERTGSVVTVVEKFDDSRALVSTPQGDETLVMLAPSIATQVRAGDTVLGDIRAGIAVEIIPKTEVSQLALEEVPDITFSDIGGLNNQISHIRDSIELPFRYPEVYERYELKPPKGVLLYGPPGCGKTMIAKAIAHSLGNDGSFFFNIKGPELLNKYVGETERRVRLIFERARELACEGRPVIIFFDEMESLFRTRGSGKSSDVETTVVPQLLAEMDGVEDLSNVIIVGATNREELIDPAILRPGRLDLKIRVERPDKAAAREIFHRYLHSDLPHADAIEELVARGVDKLFEPRPYVTLTYDDDTVQTLHYSDFVSGAMIANVVNRAKKSAVKESLLGRGDAGLSVTHIDQAVRAEQDESEDLPNTASPDEWSKITGRHNKQVIAVRVVS